MEKWFHGKARILLPVAGVFVLAGVAVAIGVCTGWFRKPKVVEQPAVYSGNPIITSIFTADPSAHVWEDGRIYIYCSHDVDPPRGCDLMDRYHVFSSGDMVHWVDEGEILSSADVAWGRKEGGFMWAPDCAYKNGTYYFYYPHPSGTDWNNTWKVGVATSKYPAKGFKDQGYIEGLGGFAMIDPCVFVDDDGRAYIYYGGGGKCQGGELNDDMMSLKTGMKSMLGLFDFHEATWVFKDNGIYYLVYADNSSPNNCMRYATANSPLGPWMYRGYLLAGTGCDTTHGSIVKYKGQWYLFYHNCSISGQGTLRSVCVDRVKLNGDGTIQLVEQTTSGVKAVGEAPKPNPKAKTYEAKDCVTGGGATLAPVSEDSDRKCVQNMHLAGAYCEFDNVDGYGGGRATVAVHFATADKLAKVNLTVNGKDYSLLNALGTGGWDKFTGTASLTVTLNPGAVNTVRFTGGNYGINIDYITVTPLDE